MLLLKKIILGIVLSSVCVLAQAHELTSQMEQRLTGNGKVYDFSFKNRFHPSVIKGIIESEVGVKIDISKDAYKNEAPYFVAKKLTYTQFLKQASDRLNLKAIQLDQNSIILVPN